MFLSPTTLSSSPQSICTPHFRRTEYYPHSHSPHVQAQRPLSVFKLDVAIILIAKDSKPMFELLYCMNLQNCEAFGLILVRTAVPCWVNWEGSLTRRRAKPYTSQYLPHQVQPVHLKEMRLVLQLEDFIKDDFASLGPVVLKHITLSKMQERHTVQDQFGEKKRVDKAVMKWQSERELGFRCEKGIF